MTRINFLAEDVASRGAYTVFSGQKIGIQERLDWFMKPLRVLRGLTPERSGQ